VTAPTPLVRPLRRYPVTGARTPGDVIRDDRAER
jgi:hypothetical protein